MEALRLIGVPVSLFLSLSTLPSVLRAADQDSEKGEDVLEIPLEQLAEVTVTTASKRAEKQAAAPGIVTVITAEEISAFGANSLLDILERATSIQMVGSALFPRNIVVMRGDLRSLFNNHILLLIDGRPVREGVSGGVDSPIFTAYPIDMIERIEIIRGPGSVLYGTNAFVGTINIITRAEKKASWLKAGLTTWWLTPSFVNATGSYSKGDLSFKLGTHLQSTGWDATFTTAMPGSPNAVTNMHFGQKNIGVAADADYRNWKFTGFYLNTRDDMLGVIPYPSFIGTNKFERLYMNLGYSTDLTKSLNVSANVSYYRSRLAMTSDDFLGELTVNWQALEGLNVLLGGVLDSRNKFTTNPQPNPIPMPYHLWQPSFYLQADYLFAEKLKLIAGVQANKPFNGPWDFVPRVGAIYDFTKEAGVKVLYSGAFRSPWPSELFLENPVVVGDPALQPEKIYTLDAQSYYFGQKVNAAVTFFNSEYSQSITRAPLPGDPSVQTFVNQGKLHMLGVELEAKANLTRALHAEISATYQHNVDKNRVIVFTPDFMVKAGASYHLTSDLTIGAFNTIFGKPRANSGERVNPDAEAVDLLSINVNYRPSHLPLEFNVLAQDIFNNPYYYTEFQRGFVNTLPLAPGAVVYASVALRL